MEAGRASEDPIHADGGVVDSGGGGESMEGANLGFIGDGEDSSAELGGGVFGEGHFCVDCGDVVVTVVERVETRVSKRGLLELSLLRVDPW